MPEYLKRFYKNIKKQWKGSLIRVNYIKGPNAKEYLSKLSKEGLIERVAWGWYWIPDKIKDVFDFLRKDKNFKIISAQTAASLWNYDFIHRNAYSIGVADKSYAKALKAFADKRGWALEINYIDDLSEIEYKKIDNLFVESIEDSIIGCIQRYAFTDAFATLYAQKEKIDFKKLVKRIYWKRIPETSIRIRQVLEYGSQMINKSTGKRIFDTTRSKINDKFIMRGIDDAVERVIELG